MCASVFAFFVSLTASYILSLGKTQIEFGFALDLSLYLTASYILSLGRTQINLVLPSTYAYICRKIFYCAISLNRHSHSRIILSLLKRAELARAFSPYARRSSGFSIMRHAASAIASVTSLRGMPRNGMSMPSSPSVMISRGPHGQSTLIHGHPHCMASMSIRGNPS